MLLLCGGTNNGQTQSEPTISAPGGEKNAPFPIVEEERGEYRLESVNINKLKSNSSQHRVAEGKKSRPTPPVTPCLQSPIGMTRVAALICRANGES